MKISIRLAAVPVAACLVLLAGCQDEVVGAWCGTYTEKLYPTRSVLMYAQFCENGKAWIDFSIVDNVGNWHDWHRNDDDVVVTRYLDPKYPMFTEYRQLGHWDTKGSEVVFVVWDRLYPTLTDYFLKGTAGSCDERTACVTPP